ncbi:isopentenyl-diphosphate Delta-isomerase [Segetibacter sp. 3557_3]|uniref:isopentenyl-diphosphate Delta-isomerase n=1 Tax=Segetibacter sp. 3557_3 TaxID=2547429 RepID=UPI0010587634|nr:isopentenyl-diphosphate Delta-isomerase [Segetibacter sp. 3557_3]TDH23338.1 isopentenyl-diphosphate Delta-isomerase [Segetibacter sp. 3557_3]
MDEVILVNEQDEAIGTMEKMEAHYKAVLHRAFSVFILNSKGEMLLQQRAFSKYHSGGLWTNACCSHPRPGEETLAAAERRLYEELGFNTPLEKVFDFTYKSQFNNGLTEHEFDHVFLGSYHGSVRPNSAEVNDFCYKPLDEIAGLLKTSPDKFTSWFHIAFSRLMEWKRSVELPAAVS